MINSIDSINLKGRKVILQLDFSRGLYFYSKTIKHVSEKSSALLIIGTLDSKRTFSSQAEEISEITGRPVSFVAQSVFEKKLPVTVEDAFKKKEIVLLENLSLLPEEIQGDSVLAQAVSRLGDLYVNECFKLSYQELASLNQIPDFLESAGGFNLMKEIKAANQVSREGLVVVLGGDKVLESIKLIAPLSGVAQHLLISGKIAESIFMVKGLSPGKEWPEEDAVRLINRLDLTSPKLHLPIDVVTGPKKLDDSYRRIFAPGEVRKEDDIYDIGPATIQLFSEIIRGAKSLVWRGPLGLNSWPEFSQGTQAIAQEVADQKNLFSILAGEELISFIEKNNFADKFNHLSTGAESMMRMIAGKEIAGLKSLASNQLIS
jgi:phosphoglycerate kinase